MSECWRNRATRPAYVADTHLGITHAAHGIGFLQGRGILGRRGRGRRDDVQPGDLSLQRRRVAGVRIELRFSGIGVS